MAAGIWASVKYAGLAAVDKVRAGQRRYRFENTDRYDDDVDLARAVAETCGIRLPQLLDNGARCLDEFRALRQLTGHWCPQLIYTSAAEYPPAFRRKNMSLSWHKGCTWWTPRSQSPLSELRRQLDMYTSEYIDCVPIGFEVADPFAARQAPLGGGDPASQVLQIMSNSNTLRPLRARTVVL